MHRLLPKFLAGAVGQGENSALSDALVAMRYHCSLCIFHGPQIERMSLPAGAYRTLELLVYWEIGQELGNPN